MFKNEGFFDLKKKTSRTVVLELFFFEKKSSDQKKNKIYMLELESPYSVHTECPILIWTLDKHLNNSNTY